MSGMSQSPPHIPVKLEADRTKGMPPCHMFILASGPREADSDSEESDKWFFLRKMESNQQFLPPLYLRDGDRITFLT